MQHSRQSQILHVAQRDGQMPGDRHAVFHHPFDMAAGVGVPLFNGGSQRLSRVQERLFQLRIQMRVLERHGHLVRQRQAVFKVFLGKKLLIFFINGLQHADHPALRAHRHAHHVSRHEMGDGLRSPEIPRIVLHIINEGRLIVCGNPPGDAFAHLEAHLLDLLFLITEGHLEKQVLRLFIHEQQRADLGIQQAGDRLDGALAHRPLVQRRVQDHRELHLRCPAAGHPEAFRQERGIGYIEGQLPREHLEQFPVFFAEKPAPLFVNDLDGPDRPVRRAQGRSHDIRGREAEFRADPAAPARIA